MIYGYIRVSSMSQVDGASPVQSGIAVTVPGYTINAA